MSNASISSPAGASRSYTVNWRLFGAAVALACIAAAAGYWRYRTALEQTAGTLLERAETLEKEKKWDEASASYQRYLIIKPGDTAALSRMAAAYGRGEQTAARLTRVNAMLDRVLGQTSDEVNQSDLRLQLAENLLRLGAFQEAVKEAEQVEDAALQPRAHKTIALANLALIGVDPKVSLRDAIDELLGVAAELPDDVELISSGAVALRRFGSDPALADLDPPTRADELMDRLVELKPRDVDARLARYRYRLQYQIAGANDDLQAALQASPDNVDALFMDAVVKVTGPAGDSELQQAETQLRRVIELEPRDHRPYVALAAVMERTGHGEQAAELLRKGRKPTGNNINLNLALVDMELRAGQWDKAEETLRDLDEQSGATRLVEMDPSERRRIENQVRLSHARRELGVGEVDAAAAKLRTIYLSEDAARGSQATLEWVQATQLLSALHGQKGEWDKAAEYARVLVRARPNDPGVIAGAAEALLKSGSPTEAVDVLDELSGSAAQTGVLLLRVQSLLMQQLGLAPAERNWSEFDRALQAAKAQAEPRWELLFCEADFQLASGDAGAAAALIRNGEEKFGDQLRFWKSAAQLYSRLGLADDMNRALAKHQTLGPPPTEQATLHAALLAGEGDYEAADEVLEKASASLAPSNRRVLDRQRVETQALAGKFSSAQQLVAALIDADPKDRSALGLGIEIALAAGDFEAAERWEKALDAADPNGSHAAYWRARRVLLQCEKEDFKNFDSQKETLKQAVAAVRNDRPRWFPIVSIAAQVAEAAKDTRQALSDYQLAVDLGDRRPATLEKLATLLYTANRVEDAEQCLSLLAAGGAGEQFVSSTSIELAAKFNRIPDAIKVARKKVEKFPEDASQRLLLANLLLSAGETEEAVSVFREATTRFPSNQSAWSGLIGALARSGSTDEARQTLKELTQSSTVPAKERMLAAAQGFELLGDFAAAEDLYAAAIENQPRDAGVALRYARVLARRSPSEARAAYERVLQADPRNVGARRELAMLLASTGEEADWNRATQILNDLDASGGTGADQRLRALLLSQKGRARAERIANCQAARQILERQIAGESAKAAITTRLLLAQTLEREAALSGEIKLIAAAAEQFRAIVDAGSPSAEPLSLYIDFLLRNGSTPADADQSNSADGAMRTELLREADARLEELSRLHVNDKDGIDALAVAYAARLATAKGEPEKAREAIAKFAAETSANANPAAESKRLLTVGRLYTLIGAHAEAEAWYRKLAEVTPNAKMLVIQSLADQGKRSEAARFCLEAAAGPLTPELAMMLAYVMTVPDGATPENVSEADAALDAAISANDANLQLLQATAVMRASRRDYDAAIGIFRRILAVDPNNDLALNNLATLLAERPNQRAEALELIERAVALSGRQPSLLDTQGTIHLKMGNANPAITCLEEATAGGTADARYYLHLAAAYQLAQREQDAAKMLAEARNFGIEKFVLTDDDRTLLQKLEQEVSSTSSTASEKL
jgi:predicted Zn-dependent protease